MSLSIISSRQFLSLLLLLIFLTAYCIQPLLVDVIKFNGGAHSSTFSLMIPHYYSMMMVGFLPTKQKLRDCDWRKGALVSLLDMINQILKKAGLVYAGAAVYIVVDSSSIVWTAVWSSFLMNKKLSRLQWTGIGLITLGVSLKACQLNLTLKDEECLGVALILISSILMGLTFVLNEKFMKGQHRIEGPNLVCMMGVCSSLLVTAWTCFWTLPAFDELVTQPITKKGGSHLTVVFCCLLLFVSGWVHSATLWYLMSKFGAVSIGVLKGLKVAIVFLLSHILFCALDPHQCLSEWTCASASLCIIGVILYSLPYAKSRILEKEPPKKIVESAEPTRESTPIGSYNYKSDNKALFSRA